MSRWFCPPLGEPVLHGQIAALRVANGVDEREVKAEVTGRLIVAEIDGVVDGTFQRLDVARIQIVAQVITERPDEGHVRVGVAQTEEVFARDPAMLALILAIQGIHKELRTHPVQVVDMDVAVLAPHQCGMAHRTASAKEVYQMVGTRQEPNDALGQLVLTAFIW